MSRVFIILKYSRDRIILTCQLSLQGEEQLTSVRLDDTMRLREEVFICPRELEPEPLLTGGVKGEGNVNGLLLLQCLALRRHLLNIG